ncbi:hypothetical protein EDD18DRAFT_1365214 [Armillaria luteobubalina]|uniref:Uncharacterized protein n=1 Tax=Armillaria luteobubalina TaxID=153913 RepID=A0AA39P5B6_9AGAR|nr:hypothetical protein EDD18DRAFT_1365214 [Armillaria luteobubalina]
MSLIVLPSQGQCIQTTDNGHHCQCLWFLPPKSSQLDPDICGWCKHSIHAHADYVSTVVDNYPANQCTVYAQETRLMQYCTCGAQFFEHVTTYNLYYISDPWTVLHYFNPDNNVPSPSAAMSGYSNDASSPFSPDTTSFVYSTAILSGDMRNISFTPAYMPSNSPGISSSYSYGDAVIFTPTPQSVVQLAIPLTEADSHSEVENSSGVQYQDDNFSANVQDSRMRFHQDYPYRPVHDTEAWASQFD